VEQELLQTVRERPVGESVLAAVGRFWLERFDRIAATDATAGLTTMARLVTATRLFRHGNDRSSTATEIRSLR
jgi:hypothetical protein